MEEHSRNKILVIAGATATGKSKLACLVAEGIGGEIISADSMQIYKHLDIGTAKPTKSETETIPHHLVDFLEPNELFNVSNFHDLCCETVNEVLKRGKVPIICGGTGLYISTFINGIVFQKNTRDLKIREQLEKQLETMPLQTLYDELLGIDSQYATRIEKTDKKRIIRALEMYKTSGITPTAHETLSKQQKSPFDSMLVVLESTDRQMLYDRIETRIDQMVDEGLIKEAEFVYKNQDEFKTAAQAIGYKEFFKYLKGEETLEQAVLMLKQSTRRYAKRQITWFKRHNEAFRYDINENSIEKINSDIIKQWREFTI